jgi:hypothetical protein
MNPIENIEHREGNVAKAIEKQTAKLPSDTFLWIGLSAMTTSLALQLMGKKHLSLFIGQWATPFLLFGIYDKIVKTSGHDEFESNVNDVVQATEKSPQWQDV